MKIATLEDFGLVFLLRIIVSLKLLLFKWTSISIYNYLWLLSICKINAFVTQYYVDYNFVFDLIYYPSIISFIVVVQEVNCQEINCIHFSIYKRVYL